jgi:hypothetical protein
MLLLALAAAAQVPPELQRLADYTMTLGACEQYMPRYELDKIEMLSREGTPKMQQFTARLRQAGRDMRPKLGRTTCYRLLAKP